MELYITRHGETDFNVQRIVQGSGVDSNLNAVGHAQAKALFDAYGHIEFDMVVTSKLKRTHQTMAHFLERGYPWYQTADINEMHWGVQEGKPSTAQSRAMYQKVIRNWSKGRYDVAFPEGENALQLAERVQRFIDWLKTRPADRILVCTHGRTLRCLTTLMNEQPLSAMSAQVSLKNTCMFHSKLTEARSFEFLKENCTRHLTLV